MQGHDRQEILISGEWHPVDEYQPLKFERGIRSGKKRPEKAEAVLEIGKRMRGNRSKPRPGEPRRTEDEVVLILESVHDELAGVPGPITVPTGRVVALGDEQGVFITIRDPGDWKLVLSRKIGDAAEIEDDERMKRVIAVHGQNSVVDDLNKRIAGEQGRNEQERRSFPLEARRPCHICDKQWSRDYGIGPQQNSEPDQNERQPPHRPIRRSRSICDKIDDRGSK